jgi:hypothetical protein
MYLIHSLSLFSIAFRSFHYASTHVSVFALPLAAILFIILLLVVLFYSRFFLFRSLFSLSSLSCSRFLFCPLAVVGSFVCSFALPSKLPRLLFFLSLTCPCPTRLLVSSFIAVGVVPLSHLGGLARSSLVISSSCFLFFSLISRGSSRISVSKLLLSSSLLASLSVLSPLSFLSLSFLSPPLRCRILFSLHCVVCCIVLLLFVLILVAVGSYCDAVVCIGIEFLTSGRSSLASSRNSSVLLVVLMHSCSSSSSSSLRVSLCCCL